jgi:hypothetical protein
MTIAHEHLLLPALSEHAKIGAVTIEGIILHAGESAGIHEDLSLAIRELENVPPCGTGSDRVGGRNHIHPLKCHGIRELADKPHARQRIHLAIAEGDPRTACAMNASHHAPAIAEMILVASPHAAGAIWKFDLHLPISQIRSRGFGLSHM